MNTRIFDFKMPSLVMGVGAAREKLPEVVKSFGRKAYVITDPGMAAQSGFEACIADLERAGAGVEVFSQVAPDPPIEVVLDCAAAGRDAGAEVVLGIGGGSSLDVAKCVAILLRHDCDIKALFGIGNTPGRGMPTVLVPTTAGTGSEVTPIAVLSDEEKDVKRGIVSDDLIADVALVDPELCVTLPPGPTAYTGMDTLTHAIEAYTNRFSVPLVDCFALEAVRLVAGNLRRCVENGRDIAARYALSEASVLGGLCLRSVNTAAVHALAYPLGGRFHVPHGIANSLLLPHVMRFNASAVGGRFARIAEAFGEKEAVSAVEKLSEDVGTARKMREFGVREGDLQWMASAAMEVQRLLVNNPREVTEADALMIYKEAW